MYIAKAYVWLNDATKRKELEDKINSDRGYESKDYKILTNNKRVCVNKRAFQACDVPFPAYLGYIDCNSYTPNGTEEEAEVLFLELAQMRDDAGTDARWLICDCTHFDDMYDDTFERGAVVDGQRYKQLNMDLFSNATPLDVAIGFKEGWIVL